MRRAITVLIAGLIVAIVLLSFTTWGLALVGGWNAGAVTFLLTTWLIIIRADSSRAPQLAAREDQTEGSARVLLVGASVASLLGAGYALHLAGQKGGAPRMLLIGAAVLTVVLSWAVINTVYTLRYAAQHRARLIPAGQLRHPVLGVGDEPVQRHRHVRDDPAHQVPPAGGLHDDERHGRSELIGDRCQHPARGVSARTGSRLSRKRRTSSTAAILAFWA